MAGEGEHMARIRRTAEAVPAYAAPWLTAIYIRLSREDGSDESYSVQNQRQRLTAFFESIASEESVRLVDFYIDDGCTGTDSDRGAFQRMLSDIDENKVNCVIVKDMSRLSRNDWECKRYLQFMFVVKNVRFISLELPSLDTLKRPDDVYDLGVSIQSIYNENHCRETSIKVRGTLNAKRRAGEFIGAFAPYGYLKDPENKHKLIIDQEAAPVIKDIFHWFVREGMSKNGIVRRLAERGVPCPTAYKRQNGMNYQNPGLCGEPLWSARGLTSILTNRVYLGHMVQGKQKVMSYKIHTRINLPREEWFVKEGTHEAIIDEELFAQAQKLLLRDTRTRPGESKLYPFSGFLRCAGCGKAMKRKADHNNVYYICAAYSGAGLCTRHSIRHDKLEAMVLTAIQRRIDLIDSLADLISCISAAPARRMDSERLEAACRQKKLELEKAQARSDGLYDDWKNGDITQAEYHRIKAKYTDKTERLRGVIAGLEEEIHGTAQGTLSQIPCFDALRSRGLTELSRGIVTELIDVIHIHEGGDIDIVFTFADSS
ncbi:MAG: recombinase family protein [Oscillospiraceae bacterium]|nr:recombinase family protein [Oscillospiraceae bacterium]